MPAKNLKEYRAKYYKDNKAAVQERIKNRRSLLKKIINEIKLDAPCTDCGVKYPPYIMQFDHLPGSDKKFSISNVENISSVVVLLEEIDKCELVCANCHAERTFGGNRERRTNDLDLRSDEAA